MGDHRLVMDLHAAISRRDWHAVERAANRIRDDRRILWPDWSSDPDATRDAMADAILATMTGGNDADLAGNWLCPQDDDGARDLCRAAADAIIARNNE